MAFEREHARDRSTDRFLGKFGGDLLKIAVALAIAWFGVKERVSRLEDQIAFTRSEISRLDSEVRYLRTRIDGVRVAGGPNVPSVPQ